MTSNWDSSDHGASSADWDLDTEVRSAFGRYELLTKLGSGGMANVYLARSRGPGGFRKLSAVKCIHPHLAGDRSFVEMFLDEARIAAAIDHPNVCSVYDFGVIDGVYYLAMDFLAGETFSDVASQMSIMREVEALSDAGAPPPAPGERHAFIARIIADAAEGLHAAHEAVGTDGKPLGVVHRDVSLPNLFLRYDGQVEVVDFGCAKAAGRIFHTEYGKVRGHIAYMAPEMLRGDEVDRRADVWSLGVALWEMLACERLFRRSAVHDTMFAIVSGEIPQPSTVAPSVPGELDAVVMRALQKDRSRRYATAREMADDLSGFLRATDHPMGRAQLETWMRRLFPGARERHNRLLESLDARPASRSPGAVVPVSSRPGPSPPVLEETRSLSDFTVVAEADPTWLSRGWRLLRRAPRRRVAVAAVALVTLALGPVVFGEAAAPHREGSPPGDDGSAAGAPLGGSAMSESDTVALQSLPALPEATPNRGTDARGSDDDQPADAPARPATGRVNVLTPGGWADVMLGSRRLGPTPGQFTLPAGTQRLRLVRGDGRAERWVTVEVRPGKVVPVVVHDL